MSHTLRYTVMIVAPSQCDRPGQEEAYGAIDLAHQTLSDPGKRKKYDLLLSVNRGRFRPGEQPSWQQQPLRHLASRTRRSRQPPERRRLRR